MVGHYTLSRQNAGFTLVELIITIALMSIVVTFAAPSFQKQIQEMKIKKVASVFESSLREAQVQAIISQKSTKLVLTNTSTEKDLKLFNVGDDPATAISQATNDLDQDITIVSDPTTLSAVSFTPNKKAYQGETIGSTRMGQNNSGSIATTGFYICSGAGTRRYLVSVDANNIIKSQESGICS